MTRGIYIGILCWLIVASVVADASSVPDLLMTTPTEICDNGLDDDGDGLIDCYDPDCCGIAPCDLQYYDPCALRCVEEWQPQTLAIRREWTSSDNNWHPYNTPIVVDLDGDGETEIVGNKGTWNGFVAYKNLLVLNPYDGSVKAEINTPWFRHLAASLCAGDVDTDGKSELFFRISNTWNNPEAIRGRMACYYFDGNDYVEKWTSPQSVPAGIPSLSDLNEDGIPELIIGKYILNSLTGAILLHGPESGGDGNGLSIAADVLPDDFCADCQHKELVTGSEVYAVYLNPNDPTQNRMERVSRVFSGSGNQGDGFTALADMDMDGDLDAVVNSPNEGEGTTTLYVWDLQEPIIFDHVVISATTESHSSLPAIRDINHDGLPEIIITASHSLQLFNFIDDRLEEQWQIETTDWSSRSGVLPFDLNGDGFFELLHRDEDVFRIINADDGRVLFQDSCRSSNLYEYPITVDIDNDGETEILCSCESELRVYGSATAPWVSTRNLWNQYAYRYTNVNDDGTIPRVQQSPQVPGNRFNGSLLQYANEFDQSVLRIELPSDTIIQLGQSLPLRLQVESSDEVFFQWTPTDYLNCSDCQTPLATPQTSEAYQVMVSNEVGCTATAKINVRVVSCGKTDIAIPNVFTPDNDGRNDVFEVYVRNDLNPDGFIQIYNRWGKVVFSANNLSSGWDGTVRGKLAPSEMYTIKVGFTCDDGVESIIGGELYLIR